VSQTLEPNGARPSPAPPFGTSQRIRNRAIWAVALFTAALPPAFVATGVTGLAADRVEAALPLAIGFWLLGLCFALWAAFPTLRHWDGLSPSTRWLGALPLMSVSLLLTAALAGVLLV
jgi:hypothetical protein